MKSFHRSSIFIGACVLAGCGRQQDLAPTPEAPDPCVVGDAAAASDAVSVSLNDQVGRPEVVVPGNDAERIVYRQLYETLVVINCEGEVVPGLASDWTSSEGGRVWTFSIAGDARFTDGVAVRALHVLDSWERAWPQVSRDLPSGEYFDFDRAVTDNVVVVRLDEPTPELPAHIAHPGLVVARYDVADPRAWPTGTSTYRSPPADASGTPITLIPNDTHRPRLIFITSQSADDRDALDANMDVVVGRDRSFLTYASQRTDYFSTPLVWDEVYGIVVAASTSAPETETDGWLVELARHTEELARDAVSVDARAFACREPDAFRQHSSATISRSNDLALLFPVGNRVARQLAERIVAMSRASGSGLPTFVAARPITGSELITDDIVAAGAMILPLERFTDDPCASVSIPGLSGVTHFAPLIQTRAYLVARIGAMSATMHGDGVPQFFTMFPVR